MARDLLSLFKSQAGPAAAAPGPDGSLLEPEFSEPYGAWRKAQTPENADKILQAVHPVIKSALRTYGGASAESPTLHTKAKLLVLNSLPGYDAKKAKLRTYLMSNLQTLRRTAAETEQIIGVPERVRLDQQHLHGSHAELSDRLGREPSDAELARHAGMTVKRIEHIRKGGAVLAEGQTAAPEEGGVASSPISPRSRDTYIRFVYGDLSGPDQFIMEHALGLHGKPKLPRGEIARKLGISAGAVSQRSAKIQKILDLHDSMKVQLF